MHTHPAEPTPTERPNPSIATRFVQPLIRLLDRAIVVVFLLWIIGQIFRDITWFTGLCFYFPSALMLLALLFPLLRNLRRRKPLLRWSAAALCPLLVILCVENHWTTPPVPASQGPAVKLIHWNVMGTGFRWERLSKEFLPLHPDIIIFSEIHRLTSVATVERNLGADYASLRIASMVLVARGKLSPTTPLKLSRGEVHLVNWEYAGRTWRLLAVDLPSDLRMPRDGVLRELTELVAQQQPDFVIGDLNAPRLSRQLSRLPSGYRHAYDEAGAGWSATWPTCWPGYARFRIPFDWFCAVPLWSLDHTLLGPRVVALKYQLHTTRVSDHRMQVLDFAER